MPTNNNELMRMTLLRPAQSSNANTTITLATTTPTQTAMRSAPDDASKVAVATAFIATIPSNRLEAFSLAAPLTSALQSLVKHSAPDAAAVTTQLRGAGIDVGDAKSGEADKLSDLLVAAAVAAVSLGKDQYELELVRRGYALLALLVDGTLGDATTVARVLSAPLILPAWVKTQLFRFPQAAATATTADALAEINTGIQSGLTQMSAINKAAQFLFGTRKTDMNPESPNRLTLRPETIAQMPASVASTLAAEGLTPTRSVVEIATALDVAFSAHASRVNQLSRMLPVDKAQLTYNLGGTWRSSPAHPRQPTLSTHAAVPNLAPPPGATAPSLPSTTGANLQVGIGDLFVVRHVVKGYRGGEVSRIENVLKGEMRSRDHRILERVEDTTTLATDRTVADEHSLESTTRYELQSEVASSLKEEHQLKAGVALSAKFGDVVQLKTNVDYSYDRAQEESRKTAIKQSSEVVEKAIKKITEQTRAEQTRRVVRETEEKNLNSFDNRNDSSQHVSGVYQWIDKLYDVQVWNHGPHLMLDLVVPNPAAFLTHAYNQQTVAVSVPSPLPFPETAMDIRADNYLDIAKRYNVSGLTPPPPLVQRVSFPLSLDNPADRGQATPLTKTSHDLALPDGYASWFVIANGRYALDDASVPNGFIEPHLSIIVSDDMGNLTELGGPVTLCPDPTIGQLGLALIASRYVKVAATTITVICKRTDEALVKWQIQTHGLIQQAFLKQQNAYTDALNSAMLRENVAVTSRSPEANLRTIQTELKRQCLSLITGQQFELFGSVSTVAGFPKLDLNEAGIEGPYIRFFESAFEWENVTSECYPYFWTGPGSDALEWTDKVKINGDDPLFDEFLRAGSARVIVPIRTGFEDDVMSYLSGGKPWESGPASSITNNPSAAIVAEIKARDLPDEGALLVEHWEVAVPTTLVKLRHDDKLPLYVETPSGSGRWLPNDQP